MKSAFADLKRVLKSPLGKKRRKLVFIWLFALLLPGSTALAAGDVGGTDTEPAYAAYNGKRLGVLTGPLMEDVASKNFPDSEIMLFNSYPDCITALISNKIDAYLGDELGVKAVRKERSDIDYIREPIAENNYSFAFRKNDQKSAALCEELNTFLEQCWADGTIEELKGIWFGEDEDRKVVDMSGLTGEKGTVKVVTTSTDPPFSYIKDGKNVGYDIDLVVRFCRNRGYALKLGDVDFAGRIPAVESGKFDFTTDMNVTPEREEQVLFSDPVCKGGIVLAVRSSDIAASTAGSADGGTPGSAASTAGSADGGTPGPAASTAGSADGGTPGPAAPTAGSAGNGTLTPQDFVGKCIAVQTGTVAAIVVEKVLGDVQMDFYNNQIDALTALRAGKADAWATDDAILRYMCIENQDLEMVGEKLDSASFAAVFPKTDAGQALCDQYSAFVDSLWADGTMAEIDAIWFGRDEDKRTMMDYEALPDTNGTLRMAVDVSILPFALVKDNRVMGYDVDIAARFCQAKGYRLEVLPMDFSGVLPSVQTGKVDFAATGITVTEERAESVLFSSENYKGSTVLAVIKDDAAAAETAAAGTSLSRLNGARIGVLTGTNFGEIVLETLPDAKISYFNSYPDLSAALEANKIDGFPGDEPVLRLMASENDKLTILDERMGSFEFGFVLPKSDEGDQLLSEINAYLTDIKASGELDEMIAKWTSGPEEGKTLPDYKSYPAPKGVLKMATEGAYVPMSYYRDGQLVGFEIDLAARFCEACGYGLKIEAMNFDGILPYVKTGKADFAAAGITITEERRKSVNFSIPYYSGGTAMAVLKANVTAVTAPSDEEEDTSFFGRIKNSFIKTFIREDRWKLFVEGILTTLLITVLTILFGTVLGFVVFILCRNGNPVVNLITRFCLWLVQGMPVVVLLMILFYVIFGSISISGIAVAVIGFTLTFGAAVFGLLKMGVGAVDNGQYEAAYALGYSNRRTFFKIILPQALPHVLPAYKGEIVGLIKATAVVGYIAVQDLTKMGDIVRSRTYEAFFPLIAVTVFYFLLEGLIGLIVGRISVNVNPKRRKPDDILKGVKTDD